MKPWMIVAAAAVYFVWKSSPTQVLAGINQQVASDVQNNPIPTVDVGNQLAVIVAG